MGVGLLPNVPQPRREAVGLLLQVLVVVMMPQPAFSTALLFNDFALQPEGTGPFLGSRGHVRVDVSSGMQDFPGSADIGALRLSPGSRFVTRSASTACGSAGSWFRVMGFWFVESGFNGAETAMTVDLVDSSGAVVPGSVRYAAKAGALVGQWAHFDEWVPCNAAAGGSAKLTFEHPTGTFQLAQLSVTLTAFESRESHDVSPLVMWLDPANFDPAPTRVSCTSVGPGECPENWQAEDTRHFAFDGDDDTVFYMSRQMADVIAVELDFGETVQMCGASILYDGGRDARWTFKVWDPLQHSWATWGEAGPSGSGILHTRTDNLPVNIGHECVSVSRVRLEMQASDFIAKLYDIVVMVQTHTCDCKRGGICRSSSEGGGCLCPYDSDWPLRVQGEDRLNPAFGWAGSDCNRPACHRSITCNNDEPQSLGVCGGPNTCSCVSGWHPSTGRDQCTHTLCGDGFITRIDPHLPALEECDDGNLDPGDGCDSDCRLEPLPAGVTEVSIVKTRKLPRKDIFNWQSVEPNRATVAITIGVPEEYVIDVWVEGDGANAEVFFTLMERELRCDMPAGDTTVPFCKNEATCVLKDGRQHCVCSAGYEGDQCEISLCPLGCDNGGTCTGRNQCSECEVGWSGSACRTVVYRLRPVVIASGVTVVLILSISLLILMYRRNWQPIASRGAMTLGFSFSGGSIWIVVGMANISGEQFGFRQSGTWNFWLPLVAGSGVWLISSLVYLRSMVQIHIFHEIPLSFPILLGVGLLPWIVAAALESNVATTTGAIICFLYTLILLCQLWPLRRTLTDVIAHAVSCLLGVTIVIVRQVVSPVGAGSNAAEHINRSSSSAGWQLGCSVAIVLVVLVHFLCTSGHMLYSSIFRWDNQEILKLYHDDYAPLHGSFDFKRACTSRSQFTEKRRSFDIEVRATREKLKSSTARGERGHGMDHSFRARIQRTKPGATMSRVASVSFKRAQQKLPRASKALRVTTASFKNAQVKASQSSPGKLLSALSFNRKQFGCATQPCIFVNFVHEWLPMLSMYLTPQRFATTLLPVRENESSSNADFLSQSFMIR